MSEITITIKTDAIQESRHICQDKLRVNIDPPEQPKHQEKQPKDQGLRDPDYTTEFRVGENLGGMNGDRPRVTRLESLVKYTRPLTRRELYVRHMSEAECEYAHAFMCGGFPVSEDPDRPSKEAWLNDKPYPHEVDHIFSMYLFE